MALRIALSYNAQRPAPKGESEDYYAEFDGLDTISAIRNALALRGDDVALVEADEYFVENIKKAKPDIVFNIAEGLRGESRESFVPSVLEMLGIPYTASGPLTLAITLDKARTKEILKYYKVPTPDFKVYTEPPKKGDKFPLSAIVKPIGEGSSKGITEDSVVETRKEFIERIAERLKRYRQPVIAERFISGREFTVAVMGNKALRILPIIEIKFDDLPKGSKGIDSYEAKWIWDDPKNPLDCISCPAKVDTRLESKIKEAATKTYLALGCRDWSRIDMRLDENNVPNVLEVNALPGMIADPKANSRFPAAARAAGLSYNETILAVLDYALERQGVRQ